MNPLDAAWLLLKGTIGSEEDKANVDEQVAEWKKIQNQKDRDEQQKRIDDERGFGEEDMVAAQKPEMDALAEELARIKAETERFKAREAKLLNPTPVGEEPAVE